MCACRICRYTATSTWWTNVADVARIAKGAGLRARRRILRFCGSCIERFVEAPVHRLHDVIDYRSTAE
jgi:hypothetical protein